MAFNVNEFVNQKVGTTRTVESDFDLNKFVKEKTEVLTGARRPPTRLETVRGLEVQAGRAGLAKEAEKVLQGKGEHPEKIFSGGFISDTFDVLNAIQYGITGVLKGKSFAEGVRTRQSFSDEDALGAHGLPGVIAGIGLDIAVDPLTWIAPWTVVRKIPLLHKSLKAMSKATARSRIGQGLGRLFVYRFGQDPIYKKLANRVERNKAVGVANLVDLARPLTKLNAQDQIKIANARKAGKLDDLPEELLETARPAFNELDKLGGEAVDAGLLKKEVYEETVGRYMARLYRSKEGIDEAGKIRRIFPKKPLRIDRARFMKRKDIPEDVRQAMGEILEAGYPTAKSLVQLKVAVENARFFRNVAGKFALKGAREGFEQLPKVSTLGELSGKFVPIPIADDLNEIVRVKSASERAANKVVTGFKFSKVILNPATHARNIMSNFILNNFEGLSPARLDIYGEAAKQLVTKGKFWQEARNAGLAVNTFAAQELTGFLAAAPEMSKLSRGVRNIIKKIADTYQKEEEYAKMAQFIFQRKKGLSVDKALEIAERATFNYAQVTPFIRRVRESLFGFPFITFTAKVTPQVARTLVKRPTKISNIGKIKNAIEKQADLGELIKERENEPFWIRDGFYIKLPMKDKAGRSAYLDLTYILPFGDLLSGQFLERGIKRETGLPESFVEASLQKLPFFNLITELGRNEDFFGNKIWKESDSVSKQMGDMFRHMTKTYLPPLIADQIPGGVKTTGERRPGTIQKLIQQRIGVTGQARSPMQEMLRQVGVKISPVDLQVQEQFMTQEKRNALETLLIEEGALKEFRRVFVPRR